MKHDVPSLAFATTSSCSSLSFAFVLRMRASILCNCDAPSEPMRCVSSLLEPSGRFFSAPRRMRSATEILAFFLRGGRILWVNLSILSFVRGALRRVVGAALASRCCAGLRCRGVGAEYGVLRAQRWPRGEEPSPVFGSTPLRPVSLTSARRNALRNSADESRDRASGL